MKDKTKKKDRIKAVRDRNAQLLLHAYREGDLDQVRHLTTRLEELDSELGKPKK